MNFLENFFSVKNRFINNRKEKVVRIFGREIFSFKTFNLMEGIIEYNNMPFTEDFEKDLSIHPKLSIVYPVYYTHNNFQDFENLIEKYNQFSDEIKSQIEIIFVDDCSKYPIKLPKAKLNMTLLRIEKDIPWNNSGARNLGACYATTPKLALMDADWFIPESTMEFLINVKLKDNEIMPLAYSYSKDEKAPPDGVHPNLYCLNKHTFFNLNCYDENWCGFYGEDIFYRKYIMTKNVIFKISKMPVYNNRDDQRQESHNLSRNTRTLKNRLKKMKKLEHKKEILKFPWVYVESYSYNENLK